ncbi:MAG: phosphatidate cytidylyltransferase [Microbacterium sp.]|uniref:phosphatidate cytidylyltransferase n=1 Tax=Microbacterium sp. TaxID=51671 RepID=UPI0039E5264C
MSPPADGTPDPQPPLTRREASIARQRDAGAHDPTAVFHESVRAARSEIEHQVAHAREQFEEANERIKQRTGRDLIVAIVIGLAIGGVVIATLVFLKWVFVALALAACVLGTIELVRAFQADDRRVDLAPQVAMGSLLVLSGVFVGHALHWVILFAAIAVVVVWRLIAQMSAKDGRVYGNVLRDVLAGVLIQVYIPFLASVCVALLRQDSGEWWVLAFIIVAVAADTGAYIAGISFGKHPMAPRISPKKTWEGFAGAVVAAVGAGLLLAQFMLHLPLWCGAVFGAAILVSATIGDLGESMLKRDLGIKDMSSWLPGHGGVLDRLDSILLSTVPALALYFLFSPLGVS